MCVPNELGHFDVCNVLLVHFGVTHSTRVLLVKPRLLHGIDPDEALGALSVWGRFSDLDVKPKPCGAGHERDRFEVVLDLLSSSPIAERPLTRAPPKLALSEYMPSFSSFICF